MYNISQTRKTNHKFRSQTDVASNCVNTNKFGLNSQKNFASKVWNMVPPEIKNSGSVEIFKTKIQNWEPKDCNCCLCKIYINNLGVFSMIYTILQHKNELFNVSFHVVDTTSVPVLGLESCKNLKLIKRICSIESKENSFPFEFSDCFGEIGTLRNTCQIEIKENLTPVVTPIQKIPHAL